MYVNEVFHIRFDRNTNIPNLHPNSAIRSMNPQWEEAANSLSHCLLIWDTAASLMPGCERKIKEYHDSALDVYTAQ